MTLVLVSFFNFKIKATKAKINRWDYIKLESFCPAKKIIFKMKRQSTEWRKILANCVSDKGLISKMLYNSIAKKKKKKRKKEKKNPNLNT